MKFYVVQSFIDYSNELIANIAIETNSEIAEKRLELLLSARAEMNAAYHSTMKEPQDPILKAIYFRAAEHDLPEKDEGILTEYFNNLQSQANEVLAKYGMNMDTFNAENNFRIQVIDMGEFTEDEMMKLAFKNTSFAE